MRTRQPRCLGFTTAAALVTALVVGGCGQASSSGAADPIPAANPVAASSADEVLTTIPPLDERFPDLFNDRGCAVGPVTPALDELSPETQTAIKASLPPAAAAQVEHNGEVDVDAMAPEVLGSLLEAEGSTAVDCNVRGETPAEPWEFYGYLGPSASGSHQLAPGTVDAQSATGSKGEWTAAGRAVAPKRNAPGGGKVTVTATLLGADGATVGTATAASPVRGARPGEPVAFKLAGSVPASKVHDVRYHVTATDGPAARGLTILVEGVFPNGSTTVIIGSVTNASKTPIAKPAGVVAVNDADGHVREVKSFVVTRPGTTTAVADLEPGFSGAFEVVVADPTHAVTTDSVEVWTFGS